jgi:hypothetical protein
MYYVYLDIENKKVSLTPKHLVTSILCIKNTFLDLRGSNIEDVSSNVKHNYVLFLPSDLYVCYQLRCGSVVAGWRREAGFGNRSGSTAVP